MTRQQQHKSTHAGEIVIRNIDYGRIGVYILLFLNLGGEVYPMDRKRFDDIEAKIDQVNDNVSDQMRQIDRRVLILENKQTSFYDYQSSERN